MDFEGLFLPAILLILKKWYKMHHSLEHTILKLASFKLKTGNSEEFKSGLKKLQDLVDNAHKNSTLKQKKVTFKTELLRVCANIKQLREFIIMNLHTSTIKLIKKLTYFNLTYHVEKDHSLGHKKNNIKCYECGQYGHKKDQCKKGKTEQGESSSYYRRGNGQDEVRSSKNKTVNHIVGKYDERSKMLDQFTIGIRIEDYIYEALIDTGAEVFVLPKRGIKIEKMIPCNKKIKGYADGEIVLCGTCMTTSRRKMYTNSISESSKSSDQCLNNVICYQDDFCVATEGNLESHMSTVFDLLKRIQQVGYKMSKESARISDENKNLFLNRKTPTNKGELVSLLASSNYFRSSIPNYENLTAGLYNLANSVTDKKDKINFDKKIMCVEKFK
uniref:CCHC-type domain-containing protein n=1 Tax=Strongyloides venezuelensis TaxID=75913 RepID=A0A0K0FRP7_STRVS